jgi:hypothetical protein
MIVIDNNNLLAAWRVSVKMIIDEGDRIKDIGIREIIDLYVVIDEPVVSETIELLDPDLGSAVHEGFSEWYPVDSVIETLKTTPLSTSVIITPPSTAEGGGQVPRVDVLDFKIRDERLVLTATCGGLDFGTRGLYAMLELIKIAARVQADVNVPSVGLHLHAISAHVQETDVVSLR